LLIGQHGANLYSLQIITHAVALKHFGVAERFSIDVDDYRRKREWFLRETAKKALEQVKRSHKPVMLEAMPAYERRVVHAYLSEDFSVETESIGNEPHRRIVIKPKPRGEI
jgi:spoIIIJ-associated protein